MGEIDISVKNFLKINTVFAQLFSQGVYGGKVNIAPEKLQELDTAGQDAVLLSSGQLKGVERIRDAQKVSMLFDNKMAFQIIMGIEGQTGVNYYMPVRCMELDAISYSSQCRKISENAREHGKLKKFADGVPKGSRILPVVTLVFYYGSEPWDGPLCVYDMLDIPEEMKEWAGNTIPDYRMNIIDAKHMTDEEVGQFDGDLKAFLLLLRERYDREQLRRAVATHRETWYAIGTIKKDKRYIEYINRVSDADVAGGVNMDATLDYLIAEGETRGKDKINRLIVLLSKDGRTEDILKFAQNSDYQTKLLKEYGLED